MLLPLQCVNLFVYVAMTVPHCRHAEIDDGGLQCRAVMSVLSNCAVESRGVGGLTDVCKVWSKCTTNFCAMRPDLQMAVSPPSPRDSAVQ